MRSACDDDSGATSGNSDSDSTTGSATLECEIRTDIDTCVAANEWLGPEDSFCGAGRGAAGGTASLA